MISLLVCRYCWKTRSRLALKDGGDQTHDTFASLSTVQRTNHCTRAIPKKNGLNKTYIMRRLPRLGSLTRGYQRRCPTHP